MRIVHLGHEYLTDVIELRLDRPLSHDEARSTLYALLEAVPSLDVARDDIDGTLHYYAANQPPFVLFDAVPGGAGHTVRIGRRLPELVGGTPQVVVGKPPMAKNEGIRIPRIVAGLQARNVVTP